MLDPSVQSKNQGSLSLPWFTFGLSGLLIGLFLLGESAFQLLVWDRQAMLGADLWRLVTGHLVHTDLAHLTWNIGAYLILGGVLESLYRVSARQQILLFLLAAATVNAAVWGLRPDLALYAGLSGVLNGYFILLFVYLWRIHHQKVTLLAGAGLLAKNGYEVLAGASVLNTSAWASVPEAHIAGALAGLAFCLTALWQRHRET